MIVSHRIVGCAVLALLSAAADAPAQASSSVNYFRSAGDVASGAAASSSNFTVLAAFGSGISATPASSSGYSLLGSFSATTVVDPRGQPWVTAVRPAEVALGRPAQLTVHGTELDLGLGSAFGPRVEIEDQPVALAGVSRHQLTVAMPPQDLPGWKSATVRNGGGVTALSEAVMILPMLGSRRRPGGRLPSEILFRGSRGDTVVLALSPDLVERPLRLPRVGHALELRLSPIVLLGAQTVSDIDGSLSIALPAATIHGSVFAQAVVISPTSGYAPAAFTNAIRL